MNKVLKERSLTGKAVFQLVHGDLTREPVDAIVNAANAQLQHGGGIAGLISRVGGPQIQAESDAWVRDHGPVPHDSPAYTSAGNLPCRFVIHAVGPVWGSGDEDAKLAAAIRGSLACAEALDLQAIAFPALSTGIFGFPKERAAGVFFNTIPAYFEDHPGSGLRTVRLTLYDSPTLEAFLPAWDAAV